MRPARPGRPALDGPAGRLLLLGLGLLIGLLAAEALARGYAAVGGRIGRELAGRDPLNLIIEPHGVYGYRQRANQTLRYSNGARAHWNALGYRGPLVAQSKPPGTIRIVLLGGSTTHGFKVDDSETIDAHMRDLLAARRPELRFEVVNLALDGYDSYQVSQRLKSDGLALSPDVVILNTGINDVRNARYEGLQLPDPRTVVWRGNLEQMREFEENGGPPLSAWIAHYSYAARLPSLLRDNFAKRRSAKADASVTVHPEAIDYFEANVRRSVEMVSDLGAGLILSTPPTRPGRLFDASDGARRGYWIVDAETTLHYRQRLAARLEEIAAETTAGGLPVAYVTHELPVDYFLDDAHLTGQGNRAVAENFVAALPSYIDAAAHASTVAGRSSTQSSSRMGGSGGRRAPGLPGSESGPM